MTDYTELFIDQGSNVSITLVLQDEDTNRFQNVDGYIITSSIRKSLLSQNATAKFNCSIGTASNGEIVLEMNSANTRNLRPGPYFFDVMSQAGNNHIKLIEGIVYVTPTITKYDD